MIPTVSIIIPTFNRGLLLLEAVASCINQPGVNVEVIVVDDGSTDGSAEEAEKRFPNIKLIEQPNQGACVARNRGLEAASGQFVKFLDSDDKLAARSLAGQVEALRKSGAGVVYGDFEFFGNLDDPRVGGKPLRTSGVVDNPIDALLGDWWCAPFAYLFRAEAISTVRWNPALSCLQDFDFILRVALSGASFVYCPGFTGYYRMHEGQITNSQAAKYAYSRCLILDETFSVLLHRGQLTTARRQLIANGYWSAARAFYRCDRQVFAATVEKIYALVPRFRPSLWAPWSVKVLTAALGIKKAEAVLGWRRAVLAKSKVGSAS